MTPRVAVVGSYPPIPLPSAAASAREVRRAWDGGFEVTVVAPRISAAHLTVAVHGLLAGRRLEAVRRFTGATRVVLVVEDGYPLPGGPAALQHASAVVLARALRRFEHSRLVLVGEPNVAAAALARLAGAASEVVDAPGGPGAPGVSALGPTEVLPSERPRQFLSLAARTVLGSRAPAVRSRVAALRRGFFDRLRA